MAIMVIAIAAPAQFAPLGAQWHYNAAGTMGHPHSGYHHYQSALDTVIAGQSCQMINITQYRSGAVSEDQPAVFTYQSGDTVYYFNNLKERFLPLYIFNVSAGDTLTFQAPYPLSGSTDSVWISIVDSVTQFIIGTDTLERVWTSEPAIDGFSFWGGYIEKIGGPLALLPVPHILVPENEDWLRCYSDSTIAYNFSTVACDYLNTSSVLINEGFALKLTVYPNPCRDQIHLQTNYCQPLSFSIYNTLGQMVKTGMIGNAEATIYISELVNGVYSLEITAGQLSSRRSFVVNR